MATNSSSSTRQTTDLLASLTPEQSAALAARIAKAKQGRASAFVQADLQNRYEPFPLTDVQQAYLIGRGPGVELGNTGCHSYSEVELKQCDHQRLETALQQIISRHEMLRCVISTEGHQQIRQAVPAYRIDVLDLRGLPQQEVTAGLETVRQQMSHQVHTTDQWPLFEFRLTHLDQGVSRLHSSIDLLIADGRSLQILFRELTQLTHDPHVRLPALELSFRDYLFAINRTESTDSYEKSRRYWLDRLAALPPAPELPLATNPGAIGQPHFVRRQARLDPREWGQLKARAHEAGLTPPGILLAAFAEILAIWSKHPRFTLDLTLFNRPPLHPQAKDIIADCTSVSLLEIDNSAPQSFEKRATQHQQQLWRDLDHRHFSGIRVLRELGRAQGTGPKATMPVVFTSLLSIGDAADETLWASQLGRPVFSICQTPQVSLDVIVHEDRQALVVNWDVVDELYPDDLLDDMFDAYRNLLGEFASQEGSWQRTLADSAQALIPARQTRIRQEVNDTASPLSGELLHTLFLKQVAARPGHTAVSTPADELTYDELYRRASAVEQELLCQGIEPNQLVAVLMEKGWEQVAGVLGVQFAGAAYLPIDAGWPAQRQRYLIEYGEVQVVLTQSHLREKLKLPVGIQVVEVDRLEPARSSAPHSPCRQSPEDLAYVIFTSGSTGRPKGVMIDHRGAVNTVLDINQRFGIGPEDRVLALSRLSFDLSVYDIFGPLAAGGTIVIPTAEGALDPAHWAQLVVNQRVTIWDSVPALMQLLVEHADGRADLVGPSLRLILMSGDWIPVGLPDQIRQLLPDTEIISLGGATEASIWSILFPIASVSPHWKSIPYGKPMLNQNFQVLSEGLTPCPDWVPGQLVIGGIGVAKGYWRDAEKTEESFIRHPQTGQRLYRTGDFGRYLPDGNIEFLGREDFQVKVQGFRIELGEIEVQLQKHNLVADCAVIVREEIPGQKRLVGYVVRNQAAQLEHDEVRDYLREELPEYMVPTALVFMDRFPLTANGKVDRQSLPAPERPANAMAVATTASCDPLELQLIMLWQKILRVRPVRPTDNFFDLGGHSFVAIRLFSEIARLTGRQLALSTLLEAPTVEQLAQVLRSDGWSPRWVSLVPIQPGGSRPPFFCVHGAGGNVLMYHPLSRRLGEDYPFYGLQSRGLVGREPHLVTVEEMASQYLDEICQLQPEGPYYLGGFCMGGLVAYEMAQQLRARGEQVNVLALFETINLSKVNPTTKLGQLHNQLERVEFHLRNFGRLKSGEKWRFVAEKFKIAWSRKDVAWGRWAAKFGVLGQQHAHAARLAKIWDTNDRSSVRYVPKPYEGNVTQLVPIREYAHLRDSDVGWEDLATGGLVQHVIGAYPAGMMVEPFVQQTADVLRCCIENALAAVDEECKMLTNTSLGE